MRFRHHSRRKQNINHNQPLSNTSPMAARPNTASPSQQPTHSSSTLSTPASSSTSSSSSSSFLSLPAEIRHQIYTYLHLPTPFPAPPPSHHTSSPRFLLPPSPLPDILLLPPNFLPSSTSRIKLNLSAQLLRTCRQIHAEAGAVLYGENRFWAHEVGDIEDFEQVVGRVNAETMHAAKGGEGASWRVRTYVQLVHDRATGRVKGRGGVGMWKREEGDELRREEREKRRRDERWRELEERRVLRNGKVRR